MPKDSTKNNNMVRLHISTERQTATYVSVIRSVTCWQCPDI